MRRVFAQPETTPAIMDRVLLALVPVVAASVWAFGWMALAQCAVALAAGAVFDGLCRYAKERRLAAFGDRSVPVTCLLVGLGIPPAAPLDIVVVAVGVAVVLAKELYGGLGRNVFNPAMAGYAAVLVAYPQELAYHMPRAARPRWTRCVSAMGRPSTNCSTATTPSAPSALPDSSG